MQTYHCDKGCCEIKISASSQFVDFKKKFRNRKAGVLLYDPEEQKVLLVQSRGLYWGPPKGSLENKETDVECAIRELKEETGLDITVNEFQKETCVRNKAIYYYAERKCSPVDVQCLQENNDANGICWIKLSCLKELVLSRKFLLNQHCIHVLKKFLDLEI